MKSNVIEALVRRLEGTCVVQCEYETDAGSVMLKFSAGTDTLANSTAPLETADPTSAAIVATKAGLFYSCHPLQGEPLTVPNQKVTKGHVVGFLAVGEHMEPLQMPCDGVIGDQQIADGTLVGYGARLIEFKSK